LQPCREFERTDSAEAALTVGNPWWLPYPARVISGVGMQGSSLHHKAEDGEEALGIPGEFSSGGGEVRAWWASSPNVTSRG